MSYRNIYENHWGKIPKGYEIHHLDIDDRNNEPENLLAVPRKLHRKYHFAHNFVKGDKTIKDIDRMIMHGSLDSYVKYLKEYQRLTKLLGVLVVWRNLYKGDMQSYVEKIKTELDEGERYE